MGRPRSDIDARVLCAARQRFLLEGVDGASLRQIAADAGTSIGMVYYYFPTKDDLFFAVVEDIYAGLLADMASALAPDVPVEQRLRRFYRRVGAVSEVELTTIRLVVREALVSSSRLDRLIDRFQRGHIPLVLSTLADGARGGTIDPGHHPALVFLVTLAVGALPQLLRRVAGDRLPLADLPAGAELADQLVSVLLHGIGARGATPRPRRTRRKPVAKTRSARRR